MKDNHNLKTSEQRILLFSVFILSLCGITYELVLGSLATYLLGNPVQQYSITIGFFLSSMGFGSYLSRFFLRDILRKFIILEVVLGLVGGLSILVLNYLFSFSATYYVLHIFFLVIIGTLVGLEIPLLTRILKKYGSLKEIISNVLTLDYMGGLAGSLLFPLLLFPFIGRLLTSIVIGVVNIGVAFFVISKIDYQKKSKADYLFPIISILLLGTIAFNADTINNVLQKRLYYDDIVFTKRSKYQQIVLTRNGNDFRLYLDGSLQFSTFDEYRYHEMLVFPALALHPDKPKKVLILGGGDGIAVRELLKWDSVEQITLVELDPAIVDLAKSNSSFKYINADSLGNKKVNLIVGDAYIYLMENKSKFDIIIADFPDPHDETISKLYTVRFYRLIRRSLHDSGIFITQSTSPLFAREAFWCIHNTMKQVFNEVLPYHVYIPTFGDWGFNIATPANFELDSMKTMDSGVQFFSKNTFLQSLHFPGDSKRTVTETNTFNKPVLYNYYLKGWKNVDY
ncbi:MAG: polyamine aminopropyltransferase [bacterium]|nr:polyamine aminopropyltransferase [bacterium]